MSPRIFITLACLVLTPATLFASPKETPTVPTYWAKPLAGDAKGEAYSSESRAGGTLTVLYNGMEVSLQGDTKSLSAVRSSTFSATLTPKGGEKLTQCRVTVRGFADTSSGGKVHLAITSGEVTKIVRLSKSNAGKDGSPYQFTVPVTKITGPDGTIAYQLAISIALTAERPTTNTRLLAKIDSIDIAASLK
ncbi:MAG: hypothetical protein ABL994_07490 [Verrucomicrobiales bacterium]